jgi:proteic killer suppression protein
VQVTFRTKKLDKCYRDFQGASREWGNDVARKYIQRIDIIQETANMRDLSALPGLNCHELKGDRAGQYAITLLGFWRLIFTLQDEPMEIVRVEEVSKHYGD